MWKEAVVAYVKVLSQYSPGGTEEYYENFNDISQYSGRNSNQVLPNINQKPYALATALGIFSKELKITTEHLRSPSRNLNLYLPNTSTSDFDSSATFRPFPCCCYSD
jgi:hypothetical protein